eukprot:XP_011679267.1 PREDICTED: histone H3.3-like [Strongylocentrotus purpuratus]
MAPNARPATARKSSGERPLESSLQPKAARNPAPSTGGVQNPIVKPGTSRSREIRHTLPEEAPQLSSQSSPSSVMVREIAQVLQRQSYRFPECGLYDALQEASEALLGGSLRDTNFCPFHCQTLSPHHGQEAISWHGRIPWERA